LRQSNAQGAQSVSGKPFTFGSTADLVNLPVFLPSGDGIYTGTVTVHASALQTQVACMTMFYLLRQAGVTSVHETGRDQYPPSEDVHMTLAVSDGKLFANVTNALHEQTSYTVFTSYQASPLNVLKS
jgi:hypothetical protein